MTIFLDTSGLIALADRSDQWHRDAIRLWIELVRSGRSFLTTSLVLVECGDGLSRLHRRSDAVRLRRQVIADDRIEVVHMTELVERRAWSLFEQRSDKEWGMTDCASFIVMGDHGVTDAFSADHHFNQAGFRALLAAP